MAQLEKIENVHFNDPKDGYLKTLKALPGLGIEIWKTREIAHLILARKSMGDHEIQCNIMFNFNGTVSISLESGAENDGELESLASDILAAILA
ncbi:MAG: hypothetical protein C4545_05640 [Anaerolineaceae bacterium]|jgi:hypothetical protein|nr:MAG: hypothetical protein C4545_05640 [Anaerolineaceae bacterium]